MTAKQDKSYPIKIREKVFYRMLRDFVFDLPGHVMSPIVIDEYQWLLDTI